jgi:hypothetical protein
VVGAVSIGSFEGSRFVRGGRYGISIDFGLEVIEKENTCGETLKSKFIDLNHQAEAHDRLRVTLDRTFCKTASLKSPMSLAPGTRSVRRTSGLVLVGNPETIAAACGSLSRFSACWEMTPLPDLSSDPTVVRL